MSYNKISIIGNLGQNPELKYTPQGVPVCTFSVATSEKKGDQETTTWFRVTVWRQQGEAAAKYLTKGSQVYVEGRLSAHEYTAKTGGQKTALEVTATEVQFIGKKSEQGQQDSWPTPPPVDALPVKQEKLTQPSFTQPDRNFKAKAAVAAAPAPAEIGEDDIPF